MMKLKNNIMKNENMIKNIMYKKQGITLIALIVTIIVMLILAGVVLNLTIGEKGIFTTAKQAKTKMEYASAKEIISLQLMEIHTDCIIASKEYTLQEIANGMESAEEITVEKYYYSSDGTIIGIVVSANEYPKYKFLIGEKCELEGVLVGNVTDSTKKEDFKKMDDFENGTFGEEIIVPEDNTVDMPAVGDDVNTGVPIEITTYITIRSNSRNTLNITNIEGIQYLLESKTKNIDLENNVIVANNNADSSDSCKIKITGTYNGQSYINNLTAFVEPKNMTTVIDKDGRRQEAFAIYNEQDLIRLQEIVTTGASKSCNAKVMNDIELNKDKYEINEEGKITFDEAAKQYNSIGSTNTPYSGIFDGAGYKISGLYINGSNENVSGLFGMVSEEGEIKNVNIVDSLYDSGRTTGGIVGYNEGRIYRCNVKRISIENNRGFYNGGIVGINNGDVIECEAAVYIYGSAAGGIVGANGIQDSRSGFKYNTTTGRIYRCYSSGYVGYSECSGIVSHNGTYGGEGYIYDCYSTAKIVDNAWSGSIVSVQSYQGRGGYISNSYYLNLNCNFSSVATGRYYGSVTNSYSNDTTVTAEKLNSNSEENAWTNDIKDENGNWKYNNGYPILKWQLE